MGYGFLIFLLSLSVFNGCAVNPVTGRPDLVLTTTEGERERGADYAKKVEKEYGLTDNSQLQAYIESLGQRLATHSPRQNVPYQFYVVEMVEPNAFALPGGFVYVSRGLLPIVNSEDELAGVVGHEIGHVAARHSVRPVLQFAFSSKARGHILPADHHWRSGGENGPGNRCRIT